MQIWQEEAAQIAGSGSSLPLPLAPATPARREGRGLAHALRPYHFTLDQSNHPMHMVRTEYSECQKPPIIHNAIATNSKQT